MVTVSGRKYPVPRESEKFKEFKKTREAKIHGIYEETMLEVDPATALANVDDELRGGRAPRLESQSGHGAAVAVAHLMNNAQTRLAPRKIINADDPMLGPKKRAEALWKNASIREATITSLADSVRLLAVLWSSAWEAGRGDRIAKSKLKAFNGDDFDQIYRRERNFAPSLSLDAMVRSRKFEP